MRKIVIVLNEYPELIDERTAELFESLLDRIIATDMLVVDAEADLILHEDMVRRMIDDRGVYDKAKMASLVGSSSTGMTVWPRPSRAPRSAITPALWRSYETLQQEYERAAAASRVPWVLPPGGWIDAEAWMNQRDSIPGRHGRMLAGPSLLGLKAEAAKSRTRFQEVLGLRVALAAHRHQLRHGQPLASLDAIDPDLLPFDPVDGFTGDRLVYRFTNGTHLVYALGADLDDDAGRHATDPDGEPVPFISDEYLTNKWDGDWVLFPARE